MVSPRKVFLFPFILSLGIVPVCAGTGGSIEGLVKNKSTSELIPGVNVVVIGTPRGAATDRDGVFRINDVAPGSYSLKISAVGYRTIILTSVVVNPGLRTEVAILLEASAVELEPVQVVADRPPIVKDVTGTVYSVSDKEMERLPVATSSEVIAMQPGVTADLHFRGGKTGEVLYLVDGLPLQDLVEGGAGSDVPRGWISGMLVETGGFEAEYGNALSGVVNMATRTGGEEHDVTVRAESDGLFHVQESDHENEVELTAGGPIMSERLHYFGSIRYLQSDTRYWQEFARFFPSPILKDVGGFAKLDYLPTPTLRISGQLLYDLREWHDYEFSWRFNLSGLPPRQRDSYRAAVMVSQSLSPRTTYSVSLSRYWLKSLTGTSPSPDTTLYQYDFFLQYVIGGTRSWFADSRQGINTLKGDITHQVNEQHLLKAGLELNLYSIYSDVVKYDPRTNIWGKPFVSKPLLNYSNDYRYYPYSGSAYVQDKIELRKDGMLLNIGLRYDFLDPRAERPAAELIPIAENEYETVISKYVPATRKDYFSPRLGFSAPFAERGYLYVNYGHFVQFPLFDYLYSGLDNVSLKKGVGVLIGNPDLEAERTKAWEISAKYAFESSLVLSATYFDKTTYNQIDVKTFIPTLARIAGDYGFAEFVNNPYANATGVELMVAKAKGAWLTGSISYTFMEAEGLSQSATQGLDYYQWGFPTPARLFPLSWDERHAVKLIVNMALPGDVAASIYWSFHSGRPYTYYPTLDGFTPLDSTIKFAPNNARMSDFSQVDLKASKTIAAPGDLFRVVVYLDVRNLLNKRNVLWVDSSGKIGGELGDITAYGQPRRARIGVRVEF